MAGTLQGDGGPPARHRVGLVRYPSFLHAWVLDLPGCIAGGPDIEAIGRLLPLVIAEHVAWLRQHGVHTDVLTMWDVVEQVDGSAFASAGGEFCFAWERTPMTAEELEHGIARMEYARADLLDAYQHLPDAILDWAPSAVDTSSFDAWAPEARTIRGIVEHVLQLEVYYRDSLRDGPAAGIFEHTGDPATERATTVALLRSRTDGERSRTYRPTRPSRSVAEEWTVRKVLRRIISHERAHTAEIVQRRTWLLLGLPPGMTDER
jgi:hypothetical protein